MRGRRYAPLVLLAITASAAAQSRSTTKPEDPAHDRARALFASVQEAPFRFEFRCYHWERYRGKPLTWSWIAKGIRKNKHWVADVRRPKLARKAAMNLLDLERRLKRKGPLPAKLQARFKRQIARLRKEDASQGYAWIDGQMFFALGKRKARRWHPSEHEGLVNLTELLARLATRLSKARWKSGTGVRVGQAFRRNFSARISGKLGEFFAPGYLPSQVFDVLIGRDLGKRRLDEDCELEVELVESKKRELLEIRLWLRSEQIAKARGVEASSRLRLFDLRVSEIGRARPDAREKGAFHTDRR